MVDQLAAGMGKDPTGSAAAFLKDARSVAVLDKVGPGGRLGPKSMPPGTAQGLGFHSEYKGRCAALVEIDCTPATVNRQIPNS